jgi:hypothetical protein
MCHSSDIPYISRVYIEREIKLALRVAGLFLLLKNTMYENQIPEIPRWVGGSWLSVRAGKSGRKTQMRRELSMERDLEVQIYSGTGIAQYIIKIQTGQTLTRRASSGHP